MGVLLQGFADIALGESTSCVFCRLPPGTEIVRGYAIVSEAALQNPDLKFKIGWEYSRDGFEVLPGNTFADTAGTEGALAGGIAGSAHGAVPAQVNVEFAFEPRDSRYIEPAAFPNPEDKFHSLPFSGMHFRPVFTPIAGAPGGVMLAVVVAAFDANENQLEFS